MADTDDDALSWEGDDRLQAPVPAPRTVADRDRATVTGPVASGGLALVVLGVLGGIAVLETVFWIRGLIALSASSPLDAGTGTAGEVAAFAANLIGRVLAAAAPVVWFGVVAWRVRTPSTRLAWLGLGAVLLLPWPFLLVVL